MWTQITFFYGILSFGVYSYVLPRVTAVTQQAMKFSSSKGLRVLSSEISNNHDFKNTEFKALLKPLLIPRMPDTENSLKVQKYIRDHFSKINWHIEDDIFQSPTPYGMKTFTNIIITHNPSAPKKLVLACHYDSKNISDSRGNSNFIAATDSAVPCAILMDLAKKLDCAMRMDRKPTKDITVQMLFLDGEEAYLEWTRTDSLYGSRHLAELWATQLDPNTPGRTKLQNIELFVLLDLIGSDDVVFRNFFENTAYHFGWLQKIEKSLKKADLMNPRGVKFAHIQDKNQFSNARPWGHIEDDHKPFMEFRRDLPVLHLISTPFPRVWHTMQDNESALNYDVIDNFNRIFRVFVSNYLHLPEKPCGKK